MARHDLVLGRIPVLACIEAKKRKALTLHVQQGATGLEAITAAARGIEVRTVPREQLDRLAAGVTHQGVALTANPLPVLSIEEWLPRAAAPDAIVLVLDGIEDPRNFGGIVRSASACGAAGVLFAKDRSAPISAAALKAAAGAFEYIDLVRVTNLARALEDLQAAGFWSAGLDAAAEQTLWDADLRGKTALVIGSEGRGIRRLVLERCDRRLSIPLTGPITSLNASVSAAVALAECVRQRRT